MDITSEAKKYYKKSNTLIKIIAVNIIVFILANIIGSFLYLFETNGISFIIETFSVPSDIIELLFKPWTIFTYMFLHIDFMHILFNMLWLYIFGIIFLQYLKPVQLTAVYILGGLSGAFFFIISYNVFPVFTDEVFYAKALGASAAVYAVVTAIAVLVPNHKINLILIGQVKIKYIAIVVIFLDIVNLKNGNAGGHIAHIGGALFGWFYAFQYKKGKDYSGILTSIINKINSFFKPKAKFKVKHKDVTKMNDADFNRNKHLKQEEIDKILDKISKHGYEKLTAEEKAKLFNFGKKNDVN